MQGGVDEYRKKNDSTTLDDRMGDFIDANLFDFADYEVSARSQKEFVMQSISDSSKEIEISIAPRTDGKPGIEWKGLPENLKMQLNVFTAEE